MSLFVVSVISLIMMQITLIIASGDVETINTKSLILFQMQLTNEILLASEIKTIDNNLVFTQIGKSDNIVYKQANDKIIRTSDNSGGREVALSNVEKANFYTKKEAIYLDIKFKKEQETRSVFIVNQQ